jgi:hypothetical protein
LALTLRINTLYTRSGLKAAPFDKNAPRVSTP